MQIPPFFFPKLLKRPKWDLNLSLYERIKKNLLFYIHYPVRFRTNFLFNLSPNRLIGRQKWAPT